MKIHHSVFKMISFIGFGGLLVVTPQLHAEKMTPSQARVAAKQTEIERLDQWYGAQQALSLLGSSGEMTLEVMDQKKPLVIRDRTLGATPLQQALKIYDNNELEIEGRGFSCRLQTSASSPKVSLREKSVWTMKGREAVTHSFPIILDFKRKVNGVDNQISLVCKELEDYKVTLKNSPHPNGNQAFKEEFLQNVELCKKRGGDPWGHNPNSSDFECKIDSTIKARFVDMQKAFAEKGLVLRLQKLASQNRSNTPQKPTTPAKPTPPDIVIGLGSSEPGAT